MSSLLAFAVALLLAFPVAAKTVHLTIPGPAPLELAPPKISPAAQRLWWACYAFRHDLAPGLIIMEAVAPLIPLSRWTEFIDMCIRI